MAKNNELAKEKVINTIIQTFGSDVAKCIDKKIYIWVTEGGERIQVALSISCPKAPIEFAETPTSVATTKVAQPQTIELSPEDKAKIEELKRKLGIED